MNTPLSPWKKHLPTQLTMSRVYVVPLFVVLMNIPSWSAQWVAAFLFIIASVTDYFDGYYARKWGLVSTFGKFLDPVTDKILVSSVLIVLLSQGKVDPYSIILLIVRDTFIGGIRSVAAADRIVMAAKSAGKWKTGLQMGAIPLLMIKPFPEPFSILDKIGYGLLWISVGLSITSGIEYYRDYLKNRVGKV